MDKENVLSTYNGRAFILRKEGNLAISNNLDDPQAFAAAAKSLQSCPTLCDPMDGTPRGSPVPGILRARTLEWVAISFSSAWNWKVKVKLLSRVWLFTTPWTAAHQAPPSMGFSRQEYWSGLPLPSLSGHHVKPNKPAQTDKYCKVPLTWGFPGGSVVKNLPAMQETRVLSPR